MRDRGYELDYQVSAAQSVAGERADFVRRVYMHLAGAVLALIGVEALLLNTVDHKTILQLMFWTSWSWLVVMLLFMGAGFDARVWAQSRSSVAIQYAGLALYVVAWAIMFLPVVIVANELQPNVIPQAGLLTGAVFGGLTLAAMLTPLAGGLRSLCSFRFLLGLGESANWPGATKAVGEWFPRSERGLAVALFD